MAAENEKADQGEFNHIREGYRLHLQDVEEAVAVAEPKDKYLKKQVLFEDEDYRTTGCCKSLHQFLLISRKIHVLVISRSLAI